MNLSEYKYLTEIHGVALVDLLLGNTAIDRLNADFKIDLNKSGFDISAIDFSDDSVNVLERCFFSASIIRINYLYGVDNNNIPFTLYDCYISPLCTDCCISSLYIPLTGIHIVWNDIIIGKHIPDKNAYEVNRLLCVVERAGYQDLVGKFEYQISSSKITVRTDYSNGNTFDGVLFELSSDIAISFKEMKETLHGLLEMYSLLAGHLPKMKDIRIYNDSREIIYHTYHDILFSKNSKIIFNKRLHIDLGIKPTDSIEYYDGSIFGTAYDKWVEVCNSNPYVFNMFRNALDGRDLMQESRASMLIQCLEGYFNTQHKDELVRCEFANKKAKKTLMENVTTSLTNSDEIASIFGDDLTKVIESVKNLLGKIHRKSLNETLWFAINRTQYTQKVFAREMSERLSEEQTYLESFVKKAVLTRNFMSHLYNPKEYFTQRETRLAIKKFELLLRLCFLHDIGLEITEQSLDKCLSAIEMEFYPKKKKSVATAE